MIVNPLWTRRGLLTRMAGAGGLAALSPVLFERRARAADTNPTRLLIFSTMMGMSGKYPVGWRPSGSGAGYSFDSGSILEPLTPFRDRLLVFNGLNNRGANDSNLPGSHPVGLGTMLVGGQLQPGPGMVGGGDRDWTAQTYGPSVDQFIAAELGVKSLELAIAPGGLGAANYKTRMCFRSPNQPVAPETNPAAVASRLFVDTSVPDTAREALRIRRDAIWGAVRGDLDRLAPTIAASERAKVTSHREALDRVRAELTVSMPVDCSGPTLGGGNAVPEQAQDHFKVITRAFKCDAARVVTLMWGGSPHNWRFEWTGNALSEGFHNLSHLAPSATAAQADLVRACRWYAEQFRDLLAMLDAEPEGSGTLLDHTLVLWTSEVSDGNTHSYSNLPFVLAGGTDIIRTGRFVEFGGLPHNRLLTTLCRAMGVNVETFGNPDYGTGVLDGVLV